MFATNAVPKEVPGVYLQDTLETSVFARNMLPACYGPAGKHPVPPGHFGQQRHGLKG